MLTKTVIEQHLRLYTNSTNTTTYLVNSNNCTIKTISGQGSYELALSILGIVSFTSIKNRTNIKLGTFTHNRDLEVTKAA